MGEYWKPVNLTRGEFIHPHHVDCGLKLGEWWEWEGQRVRSAVRRIIETRWSPTDDVRALSDYGRELQLTGEPNGPAPEYEDIEDQFTEVMD